jgi:hypothetical protein
MADFHALNELRNQQRPVRRNEKTYGKKKAPSAATRALHLDLFGGMDENSSVDIGDDHHTYPKVFDSSKKLEVSDHATDKPEPSLSKPDQDSALTAETSKPAPNPRLRGRRKIVPEKKMAACSSPKRSESQHNY